MGGGGSPEQCTALDSPVASPTCKEFADLAFQERMTVDPKKSSISFILQNTESQHHFERVEAVVGCFDSATSDGLFCHRHQRHCIPPACRDGCADILVIGFPCSPFSGQRVQRHLPGRLATCSYLQAWVNMTPGLLCLPCHMSEQRVVSSCKQG